MEPHGVEPCARVRTAAGIESGGLATASSTAETSGSHRRVGDGPRLSAHGAERREACVVEEGGVDESGGDRRWCSPSAEPLN